jgi:predicted dehydrogenase
MIRVGLLGAGIFARETYIPNIEANSTRVKLTAILASSQQSVDDTLLLLKDAGSDVNKFFGSDGEENFFASAKDICDAVIIVVPIPLLGRYVQRCLIAGLHVFSEKPVAMTSVEGSRLISLYHEQRHSSSVMWHVAENYRLEPAVCYASEIVRNYTLPPKSFTLIALRQQSVTSKFAVTPWRAKPEYNGSYVLDGGIHFVALLRTVLGGSVRDVQAIYEERSVVEVGSCGACRAGDTLGTFQIRYGAFLSVVCRMDVYWDDAIMSIIQHKGVGYEVIMTGQETRLFEFEGLQEEFKVWLNALESGECAEVLSPEEALKDLLVVEAMCCTQL